MLANLVKDKGLVKDFAIYFMGGRKPAVYYDFRCSQN